LFLFPASAIFGLILIVTLVKHHDHQHIYGTFKPLFLCRIAVYVVFVFVFVLLFLLVLVFVLVVALVLLIAWAIGCVGVGVDDGVGVVSMLGPDARDTVGD
jgi:hypothetical protein